MIIKNKEKELSIRRKRARDLNVLNYTADEIAYELDCHIHTVYEYLRYWKRHEEMKKQLNGKKLSSKQKLKDLI